MESHSVYPFGLAVCIPGLGSDAESETLFLDGLWSLRALCSPHPEWRHLSGARGQWSEQIMAWFPILKWLWLQHGVQDGNMGCKMGWLMFVVTAHCPSYCWLPLIPLFSLPPNWVLEKILTWPYSKILKHCSLPRGGPSTWSPYLGFSKLKRASLVVQW